MPLDHFNSVLSELSSMRDTRVQSRLVALAIFPMKMRLAFSNGVLACVLHLKGKRQVSGVVDVVCLVFSKTAIPRCLGFQKTDRRIVLREHQKAIATKLMTDSTSQLVIVMDGTYRFMQKSSDNRFQRRSFNMHKQLNRIQLMISTVTVS